jgi:hypothetical protein
VLTRNGDVDDGVFDWMVALDIQRKEKERQREIDREQREKEKDRYSAAAVGSNAEKSRQGNANFNSIPNMSVPTNHPNALSVVALNGTSLHNSHSHVSGHANKESGLNRSSTTNANLSNALPHSSTTPQNQQQAVAEIQNGAGNNMKKKKKAKWWKGIFSICGGMDEEK